MKRIPSLVTGEVYHIFNRSIYDFVIFNNEFEFSRLHNLVRYYQICNPTLKFNRFLEFKVKEGDFNKIFSAELLNNKKLVQIIAYCIMPTHFHIILKQLVDNGISIFMGNVLNGYSRYFNAKHKRKGPLWEGRFKNVLVQTQEQLLHLTRYVHLNPTSAGLINKPEDWPYSSYLEYLNKIKSIDCVCLYKDLIEMPASSYRLFVEDRIVYQRELEKIKHLVLDY